MISTTVVFPVFLLFTFYLKIDALLILIYVMLLTGQPGFAKNFKAGGGMLAANLAGGLVAILVYELLVVVAVFPYLLLMVSLWGLIFGAQLFSGKPAASLYGSAFSTFLVIIGMTTNSQSEADTKVYTRIFQTFVAVVYIVVASGLITALFDSFTKRKLDQHGVMKRLTTYLLVAIGLVMIPACVLGPDYQRNNSIEATEYSYDYPAGDSIVNIPWWELYQDLALKKLIVEALANNRDLASAVSRMKEAEASLGVVRSNLYPNINYGLNADATATALDGVTVTGSATPLITVSYQVDLWGKIKRMNEAAFQEYLATEQAYRQLTIIIVSSVAEAYLVLRDLDNRLIIAEQTADTWEANLDIVQARLNAGMVSQVDYNQALIQLSEARTSIQTFNRLRVQTANGISTLLGAPPRNIERGLPLNEQVLPPEIPTGFPSELLDRRPDLLLAERRLEAQTSRIGVAEALRYPQLTLTADMAVSFANPVTGLAALGAQVLGPVFNAGANKRKVEIERYRTEQLLYGYEQTFLNALREVEDAMVAVETYRLEYEERVIQVNASNEATILTWERYEQGLTSYLEVLDLQRSQFSSQLRASETLQLHLTSIVRLYLALGGGWYVD